RALFHRSRRSADATAGHDILRRQRVSGRPLLVNVKDRKDRQGRKENLILLCGLRGLCGLLTYFTSTISIAMRSGPSIIAARVVPHGCVSSRNLTPSPFRRVTVRSRSAVLSAQWS